MANRIFNSSSPWLEKECKEIHDLVGRLNLNHLVRSLACKSKLERQQIRDTYKAMYGEDISSLFQKLSVSSCGTPKIDPRLCEALSLWMLEHHERDAIWAREALDHQGDTNYKALVQIFVGRKSSHVVLIKHAYQARFRRQLDQDIIDLEPPNPYQKILVALATSHKAHQADASQHIAKCDARRLYEAGEGGSGAIDEAVVLEILSKRSIPQMKLTFSSYKHIYGHEYTQAFRRGDFREFDNALKNVIKFMCNAPHYYAKDLHKSIRGTSADKGALLRTMMSRVEVDMDGIKRTFKETYGKELRDAFLENVPSGDFRDFLVALATKTSNTASSCQ